MRKRVLVAILVILLCCTGLVTLASCGENQVDALRERLTQELEAVKDSEAPITKAIKRNLRELTTIGLDTDTYIDDWLESYSYSLDDITLEGDRATAKVEISIKQLGPAVDKGIADINDLATYDASFSELTAGFMVMVGELLDLALFDQPITTSTINLGLIKTDTGWEIDLDFTDTLKRALTGDSVLFNQSGKTP